MTDMFPGNRHIGSKTINYSATNSAAFLIKLESYFTPFSPQMSQYPVSKANTGTSSPRMPTVSHKG